MLVAKALAEGQGLVYGGVVDSPPAAKFPPFYPMLLAGLWAVFHSIGPVTLAATFLNLAFLAAGGALFAHALVATSGLTRTTGLAVAALAFASTDVLRTGLVPLSESVFLLLFAASLFLWRRCTGDERHALVMLAGLLLALVATRTAGLAVVVAFAISLAVRRSLAAAAATTAPAFVFVWAWSRWSSLASERIQEGARDLLGPYGSWLVDQTISARGAFLAQLPSHALGVVERASALAFPGASGVWLWVLAALVAPLAAFGIYRMITLFPPLGWFTLVYLGMLLVWPYLDRRLLVPLHPGLLAAVAVGGMELARRARSIRLDRVITGGAVVWIVAYTSVTAGRIAEGWPSAPYRLRADRLAASVEALSRTVPDDATVGAPEFWAALHLHGGWTVAPSVRFDPRRVDAETPMWGTPDEQLALWRDAGIDHLLLEQGGMLHSAALDQLEDTCPGSVFVLAQMSTSLVVRIDWASTCESG